MTVRLKEFTCSDLQAELIPYLEKSLSQEQQECFDDHLSGCSYCRTAVHQVRQVLDYVETDRVVPPDPFFFTRLLARHQKVTEGSVPLFLFRPAILTWVLLVGFAIGILTGTFLHQHTAPKNTLLTVSAEQVFSEEMMISDLLQPDNETLLINQ